VARERSGIADLKVLYTHWALGWMVVERISPRMASRFLLCFLLWLIILLLSILILIIIIIIKIYKREIGLFAGV
jgi:hypothetical protein